MGLKKKSGRWAWIRPETKFFSLEIVDDQRQLEKLGFLMAKTMTIAEV